MWREYLSKAETNLAAAVRDLEHGGCDPCASRAYFAAFHAALTALTALLALTDYQRQREYWNHGHIAAEFARRLIRRRKVFLNLLADTLDNLRLWRHKADYESRQVSHSVASQNLATARQFVEKIKATIGEREL